MVLAFSNRAKVVLRCPELLNIEVAYALPERQTVLCIRVAPETNVLAAIEQSASCKSTRRSTCRSTSSVSTAVR